MGGERAATTRRRLAGKICCKCGVMLEPPDRPGERYCEGCEPRPHRVLMNFFVRGDDRSPTTGMWIVNFLEPDCQTSVGPIRTYPHEATVRHLATRGHALRTEQAQRAFATEIKVGRGTAWLQLTAEQYRRLGRG